MWSSLSSEVSSVHSTQYSTECTKHLTDLPMNAYINQSEVDSPNLVPDNAANEVESVQKQNSTDRKICLASSSDIECDSGSVWFSPEEFSCIQWHSQLSDLVWWILRVRTAKGSECACETVIRTKCTDMDLNVQLSSKFNVAVLDSPNAMLNTELNVNPYFPQHLPVIEPQALSVKTH